MNNLYKAIILAYNKDMFTIAAANNISKFMLDFNIDIDMMLIQYKNIDRVDLDKFLDSFRRTDGQYVFEGNFYYRNELEKIVGPYCKEMCISVVPKMPKNNRDFIDTKKDYGYLTIATMSPTILNSKIEMRSDSDINWDATSFPRGSGGPYDYKG